jgi:secondary thiamine-phosphate synthase enzyme
MKQAFHRMTVATAGRGLFAITDPILQWVRSQRIGQGQLCLWCRHSSASLLVQDHTDPALPGELERFLAALVPDEPGLFAERKDGTRAMPSFIRAALGQTQLCIPVLEGWPVLGRRQGIFLWEHRDQAQKREVVLHLLGEA